MALPEQVKQQETSDRPLADYFWIAGLDTQDLLDAFAKEEQNKASDVNEVGLGRPVDETIQEDAAAEELAEEVPESPVASSKHSRQNSYNKLLNRRSTANSSILSSDTITNAPNIPSHATIRRVVSPNTQIPLPDSSDFWQDPPTPRQSRIMNDIDFDDVMKRFTSDRDAFYLDLNFRSDAVAPQPSMSISKPRPRTQRIIADDLEPMPSTPTRALGSVRRHMSFKEMNSTRRQPSIARRVSTRSARRMSSYNSVMPLPRPLQTTPDAHPLKHSFEPVLLDRYPRQCMFEEARRRDPFPDFVPMFAFPNDIHIISSDTRPAAKWHEFSLTGGDNSKTPAVCVIIWIPLEQKTADALEARCEDWRRAHMSEAERELAASLGERLAIERASLSRLLAKLPSIESGTVQREILEDEIGVVEEKIALMTDMLKPLRHGAANRIEGLTDGDTGLWAPRAYGILGKDQCLVAFWKEWLKAIVIPMLDGAILRVPPSSPRVGMWQPLERYVEILCTRAPKPVLSRTQTEVAVRELRLYAKREASNELPGSRTVDLYPLFRSLTIPNIVTVIEYLLAEFRIILVSTHVSMLKLASNALLSLIWPLEWSGIYIPVLPTRLMEFLDAPIPYICGVVKRNDNLNLPQDNDFVMVDLDANEIHATAHPPQLPKQQRRKLLSMLYLTAPLHQTRGVSVGPPAYAYETFPHDSFVAENSSLFSATPMSTNLGRLASLSSNQFGSYAVPNEGYSAPLLNVFAQAKPRSAMGTDRPRTGSTTRRPSHTEGSDQVSPNTANFPPMPTTPRSRHDSGFAMQASLKEKRLTQNDLASRYSSAPQNIRRKASLPFVRHNATYSQTSDVQQLSGTSTYAASTYAQSTLAASTVMPGTSYQPVKNDRNTNWIEGHCMQWQSVLAGHICSLCDEKGEDGLYRCADCLLQMHARCMPQICLPCRAAFYPDQVRVAFARLFTSLFYNYRRFMLPADTAQSKLGLREKLNVDAWIRSLPPDHGEYMDFLKQTQAFDEFVSVRETKDPAAISHVMLFDALMTARRARTKNVRSSIVMSLSGRNPFAGRSHSGGVPAEYLSDTSTHLWKPVSTPKTSDKAELSVTALKGREYLKIVSRTPGKLEDVLFSTSRKGISSKLSPPPSNGKKSLRQRMNGLSMHAP